MAIAWRAAVVVSLFGAVIASVEPTSPQETEPRSFANTPVGLNFLLVGYSYLEGNVVLNASSPISDAQVESHSGSFAYVRAIDVAGMSGKIGFVLRFAQALGEAELA
jgi:hypothetical protein